MTSEPKPGALAPAGVGRSSPATAGSALVSARAAAVADGGGVMRAVPRADGAWGVVGRIQPDRAAILKAVYRRAAARIRSFPRKRESSGREELGPAFAGTSGSCAMSPGAAAPR